MALVINDRVKETSTTSGAGDFTLAGASTGFITSQSIGIESSSGAKKSSLEMPNSSFS